MATAEECKAELTPGVTLCGAFSWQGLAAIKRMSSSQLASLISD